MKLFCANSYCNPDDPRDFIFASSTNDRLGALPNLARGRLKWGLLVFGMIGLPVLLIVLKSNLLDHPPTELSEGELVRLESEGTLVRIGRNPARYVGVKNGEKLYYVLEGDTLKRISAAEAEAYAK